MGELFLAKKTIIIFLHVISGVVWVGGMVAMRYAAHQSFVQIESPAQRLERIAHALKRLFSIVFPFVLLLIVTAVMMLKGYDLSHSDFAPLGHAKEGIWSIMFLNLIVMIKRRNRAQRALEEGDVTLAKTQLEFIGKYQVPANILLGVVAIFLGSYLSTNI